jgi:plasmid maintenance system antidote protein VapI
MNEAITTKTKLRTFLDDRGVRYSFIAAKLGISNPHLNHILNGERPLLRVHAERLAAMYGVAVEEFMEDAA